MCGLGRNPTYCLRLKQQSGSNGTASTAWPAVVERTISVFSTGDAERSLGEVFLFGLAYVGFTHDTTSWGSLLPWFLLAGIGIGCVETAEHAAVATHSPTDIRGSAFGLLAATQSFGNLAASLVAGILWTAFSPSWAFAYLAFAMAVALVTLVASGRRS